MKFNYLTSDLYPKIVVTSKEEKYEIYNVISHGVASGKIFSYEDSKKNISLNDEPIIALIKNLKANNLMQSLNVNGIITTSADKSSHIAVTLRARGVPIIIISNEMFDELEEFWQGFNAGISTEQKEIIIGEVHIDSDSCRVSRIDAMQKIKTLYKIEITSNSDTAMDVKNAIKYGFESFWPRSEILLYEGDSFACFFACLIDPSPKNTEKFKASHSLEIEKLLRAAGNNQLAFRLLDPAAHEFLPDLDDEKSYQKISEALNIEKHLLVEKAKTFYEVNPMIGFRGTRILLSRPDIATAQIDALFEAWLRIDEGSRPEKIKIFAPFVTRLSEVKAIKEIIDGLLQNKEGLDNSDILFGIMVETPSILAAAGEIVKYVDFVSFGTNDLVATYYCLSRGDCYERFLSNYIDNRVYDEDPFLEIPEVLEIEIEKFCQEIRANGPDIQIDICGDHTAGKRIWNLINKGCFDSVCMGTEQFPSFLRVLNGLHSSSIEETADE